MTVKPEPLYQLRRHHPGDGFGWIFGFGRYAKAHYWPTDEKALCGLRDCTMDEPSTDCPDDELCGTCLRIKGGR